MKVPDFSSGSASLRFHREVFEEHLETAAFLYEQRMSRLGSRKHPWHDVAQLEARIENHIDALVVGREPSLAICAEHAAAGEPGELFAALCVACRCGDSLLTAETLRNLDHAHDARVQAVKNALCLELPHQWVDFVEKALSRCDVATASLLASVSAYRNLPLGAALRNATLSKTPVPMGMVEALGRLRVREAQGVLENCLLAADTAIRSASLLALCRIGAQEPLRQTYLLARQEAWPRVPIGLGGDRQGRDVLLWVAKAGVADPHCLQALGLIGDPAALALLCEHLQRPELAEVAAQALHWITGAALFDETFVPEPLDENELIGAEVDAWRERKEAPKRTDGTPFGETVVKLSCDPARWQSWIAEHAPTLDPQLRYRNGKLYTPAVLVENLLDARSDPLIRCFAAQELAIRYGCEIPFDVDMPVAQQLRRLAQIKAWAEADSHKFHPGKWYFMGRLQ